MNFPGLDFSIHKDGFRFIGAAAAATLLFSMLITSLAWFFAVVTLFCTFFFRNPKRSVPSDDNLIVSPADGTVCAINFEVPSDDLGLGEDKRYRISIFLSIFNVHVNRLPVSGRIRNIIYSPGSFLNAALEKASIFNEKNTLIVEVNGDPSNLMALSQIAGMIGRRIVCDVHDGQDIAKGRIFGIIRFGSRVDIWLPVGIVPRVCIGQTMVGGETILSDFSSGAESPLESVII
ncbi:MAG: phosphatidylserine decarboxylase family protein [Holosporales bacterium]|jgi:phosphatidylserine decarboxylase|nr:phosphatidylserine decarboxylase family protein [Holosporales bacterium]